MTPARVLIRFGAAVVLAAGLSGCISLLPKNKPAQLYRFGEPVSAAPQAPPPANAIGVFWTNGDFQRESANDRILTITGDHAAYIAETRWVAPAQVLFQQAVEAAFEAQPGHVRLVARGTPSTTDVSLRLDVRNFETRYDAGPKQAPTILVRVHALMTHERDRTIVSEQEFEAREPARDNRVGAITGAYDRALRKVLDQVVAWTNQKAA
ncbi:MAG TPA: ABC-type transport auxiliary lipoprotein family protein [Phenylobacterium sp.]|jgi:cholesterol transport system auxiliary component|nr:ABC-type transport auxiliary lipoprotein family protein [Phenylobacterium sp.]